MEAISSPIVRTQRDGRDTIVIDVNRMRAIVLFYCSPPGEFERYASPPGFLAQVVRDVMPLLWQRIETLGKDRRLPRLVVAHFGAERFDVLSENEMLVDLHRRFSVREWHSVSQSRTVTFHGSDTLAARTFAFKIVITLELLPGEMKVTIPLAGADVNKTVLAPA